MTRTTLRSPIGTLVIQGDDEAVTRIWLPGRAPEEPGDAPGEGAQATGALAAALEQLSEYFAGERRRFDVPVRLGGTAFQRDVWTALASIPYGTVVSYADLAGQVGRPHAFRAVGQANGANPVPIVLPCHRVVASGGRIGGYGGGLAMKRQLLALEGVRLDEDHPHAAGS